MTQTARQGLGAAGERLARHHLEQQGFTFIAANWRYPGGELDLIMREGEVLVFVEVKTRRGDRLGAAEESVTQAQIRRLLRAAQTFLTQRPEFSEHVWRIDLFSITLASSGAVSRLTHIPNAILSS